MDSNDRCDRREKFRKEKRKVFQVFASYYYIDTIHKMHGPPWQWGDYQICPYGHLSWIIPILAILGGLLFLSAAFDCTLTISRSAFHEVYIGYWYREMIGFSISNGEEKDGNMCVTWEDTAGLFDGLWRFGKAVGVLGSLTCIPTALFDLVLLYRRFQEDWIKPLIVLHFGNALMCLFLLCGLQSNVCKNENCRIGRGGIVAIVGFLFCFIDAILLMCLKRKESQLYEEEQEEFLALPGPEKREQPRKALPSPPKPKKQQKEVLALPPAQELESDSDDEEKLRLSSSQKKLKKKQKKKKKNDSDQKALPSSKPKKSKKETLALPSSSEGGRKPPSGRKPRKSKA